MTEIMARWHKINRRCDYCHMVHREGYVLQVSEGPCQGLFGSPECYRRAREEMETKKINKKVHGGENE